MHPSGILQFSISIYVHTVASLGICEKDKLYEEQEGLWQTLGRTVITCITITTLNEQF